MSQEHTDIQVYGPVFNKELQAAVSIICCSCDIYAWKVDISGNYFHGEMTLHLPDNIKSEPMNRQIELGLEQIAKIMAMAEYKFIQDSGRKLN